MFSNFLGKAFVEFFMFHVDHHTGDFILGNLISDLVGFFLGWHARNRNISNTVGEQYHQGLNIRVSQFFAFDDLVGQI